MRNNVGFEAFEEEFEHLNLSRGTMTKIYNAAMKSSTGRNAAGMNPWNFFQSSLKGYKLVANQRSELYNFGTRRWEEFNHLNISYGCMMNLYETVMKSTTGKTPKCMNPWNFFQKSLKGYGTAANQRSELYNFGTTRWEQFQEEFNHLNLSEGSLVSVYEILVKSSTGRCARNSWNLFQSSLRGHGLAVNVRSELYNFGSRSWEQFQEEFNYLSLSWGNMEKVFDTVMKASAGSCAANPWNLFQTSLKGYGLQVEEMAHLYSFKQ